MGTTVGPLLASVALALVAAALFAVAAAMQHFVTRSMALARSGSERSGPTWLPVLGLLVPLLRLGRAHCRGCRAACEVADAAR